MFLTPKYQLLRINMCVFLNMFRSKTWKIYIFMHNNWYFEVIVRTKTRKHTYLCIIIYISRSTCRTFHTFPTFRDFSYFSLCFALFILWTLKYQLLCINMYVFSCFWPHVYLKISSIMHTYVFFSCVWSRNINHYA